MKLLFKISILTLGAFVSCTDETLPEKNDNESFVCGVKDPIKDLKWLNDEFNRFKSGPETEGIILYKYNDQYVIEVQNSLFSSTNIHQHYCNGTKLNLEDPKAFSDFKENATLVKILYGIDLWKQLNL